MSIRDLHPDLAEKAKNILGETPEKMTNGLKVIKEWLASQPHLIARTDDQFLASYLRGCKFNLDKVKEKLDIFYTSRTVTPDFFQVNHTHELFYEIFSTGFYITLPRVGAPGNKRISLTRLGVLDFTKYTIMDVLSVANLIDKIIMVDDDNSIVAGSINIVDLQGLNLAYLFKLSPNTMKKLIFCTQDAFPFRVSSTYFNNSPPGFDLIINAVKLLLEDSASAQIHLNLENLSPETLDIIPVEYGGNGSSIEEAVEYWKEKIKEYKEWLDEDLLYGTDESKRVGGPRTSLDMFGEDRIDTVPVIDLFGHII